MEKRDAATVTLLYSASHNPSGFNEGAYGIAKNAVGVFVEGSKYTTVSPNLKWHIFKQCGCQ